MAVFYRRLFFWVFFLLFLATAPVVIFYSQGYRFDQYKKIFIHSGSVTVKSTPASASIFLNGEIRPSGAFDMINNSLTLNGLRPGNYNLRISADGYESWEKNIEVHSGISTEFWNVYLASKNPSPQELPADGAEKYFPSSSGKNIAYFKKKGDQLEIWSLNTQGGGGTMPVFSQSGLEFSDNALENMEWNGEEKLFIVPVRAGSRKDFLILDSEKTLEPVFLSKIADLPDIDRARWKPGSRNEIYFSAKTEAGGDNLYRLNLDTKTLDRIVENIKTYDLSSNSAYFLRKNGIIYKADLDGGNEDQIILTPIVFSEADADIRLIAYDDKRQAVLSETGELHVHNNGERGESLKKIADGAKSIQFSNDGKKLLYWTENEINVLFLRNWDVQPRRIENEIQQIIRFSSPIKNVFWYRDYEHVFFSVQNSVKLIELDSRDHRTLFDLWKGNSENILSVYDSANGVYYFADEIEGRKKIFYLYIPEQTSFFGG